MESRLRYLNIWSMKLETETYQFGVVTNNNYNYSWGPLLLYYKNGITQRQTKKKETPKS